MRTLASLRWLAVVLLLPAVGACYYVGGVVAGGALLGATLGAASTPRPLPVTARYPVGSGLLVDFAPSRDLAVAIKGDRDSVRVSRATRVVGELRQTRGDTLWIAVSQLQREGAGPMSFAQGHPAMLAVRQEELLRVHVIAPNNKLAQRTLLGAVIGGTLAFLAVYGLCAVDGCFYYD